MLQYKNLKCLLENSKNENNGIVFIDEDKKETRVSYKHLYEKALKILGGLQAVGIESGDELVYQIENEENFIYITWACILGGIIPVPLSVANTCEEKTRLCEAWGVLKNPYLVTAKETVETLKNSGINHNLNQLLQEREDKIIYLSYLHQFSNQGEVYDAQQEEVAFVMFSSGATGMPKGVTITHKNVLSALEEMINCFKFSLPDVFLGWLPLTHTLGMNAFHILPLALGLKQVIMTKDLFIQDPIIWLDKAYEHDANILISPNFGLNHFLKFFDSSKEKNWDLSHVRAILMGGEPISIELVDKFIDVMSDYGMKKKIISPGYGMTESGIAITSTTPDNEINVYNLNRNYLSVEDSIKETSSNDGQSFIGMGAPTCNLRICDEENNVLDEGMIGHIQVKGENIILEYYNNPEKTNNAFTEDGWFKTEDIGFVKNGELVITGREDDLIIVNGQNYYVYDIERIVKKTSGRTNVAACGISNEELEKEELLIAVEFDGKLEKFVPLAMQIKKGINNKLGLSTENIIPVDNIPKTGSGKIQRFKLIDKYKNGDFTSIFREMKKKLKAKLQTREIKQPTNITEKKLVKMWSDTLEITNISINDSFFELGGNSLKATELRSKIHKEFKVKIPLTKIFTNRVLKDLAKYIIETDKNSYSVIEKVESREYYPVSSSQKRLLILDQYKNIGTVYNEPHALVIKGKLNKSKLEKAFKKLIKRHEIFRTYFEFVNGEFVQKVNNEVDCNIKFIKAKENEVDKIIDDFIRPFNLSSSPLLRVKVIEIAETKHILLIDIHHIITDGTSMAILLKELSDLYEGRELEELKIQYKDYAVWQNKLLQSEELNQQRKYWLNKLSDSSLQLDLSKKDVKNKKRNFAGDNVSFKLDKDLTKSLKEIALSTNTTLYMVLLAAYNILLYKYTGQRDIVMSSPIAGRNHADLESIMGMFVNLIILRNKIDKTTTFKSFLIKEVKENTLEAYENQDYPYEKIIQELNKKRNLERENVVNVHFALQNMEINMLDIAALECTEYELNRNIAKFDINLVVNKRQEELEVNMNYSTELFKEETIKKLGSYYINILEQITDTIQIKLEKLELFPKEKRDELNSKIKLDKQFINNMDEDFDF